MDAAALSEPLSAGAVVADRFEIEALAGAGGMGRVYRARDRRTGETVALKVVRIDTAEAAERFAREADLLAATTHPGVVRYAGHGRGDSGELFLAMEWLEGEDLGARLARGPLSVSEAMLFARRLADALGAVHACGIVHRDVKPSNVFLRAGAIERPALLDFGIARRTERVVPLTRTGMMLGTPLYMAPEQIRGARDLDARADVFALGCVLYECLSGHAPFLADQWVAVLARVLVEDPPLLGHLRPDVPPRLEALVARMLAKAPAARPSGAAEVAAEIDRIAAEVPGEVPAIRDRPPTSAQIGARERRLCCVVLGADRGAAFDRTATPAELSSATARLRQAIRALGGDLAFARGGDIVVTVEPHGPTTDQATCAARCALELSRLTAGGAAVAVAMGWAETGADLPAGEVIDRAVAMLDRAPVGAVVVDETAADVLEQRFEIDRSAEVFRLAAERERSPEPRTVLGRPTRCVGRDREIAVLEGLLAETIENGIARAALVTAPAGTGKSRLRHEVALRMQRSAEPPALHLASGDTMRAGSPLHLLTELLRSLGGIGDAPPGHEAMDALRARLADLGAPSPEAVEFLGEIAGVVTPGEQSPRLDAARRDARLMGDQMLRAWLHLLDAACARGPVVLAIEDLHWADVQTVRYLDASLRDLAHRPLLVLAFARPEVHDRFPGLFRERDAQEIRLGMLPPRACERLVRDVLGDVAPDLLERIVRRSEGNALFLEEMIRAASRGEVESVPTSVLGILQSRLGALDAGARRILRAASVFGTSFRAGGVLAVAGARTATDETVAVLDQLVAAEVMIARGGSGAEAEYAFRHAIVRDAAYAMLIDEDRLLAHRLAARWLESHGVDDPALLAGHFEQAGDSADAARCWSAAAAQALDRNDFDGALAYAEHSIARGAQGDLLAGTHLTRARAFSCLGRWAESHAASELALELTPPAEADRRIAVVREMWHAAIYRQDAAVLRRTAAEALAIAEQGGRDDLYPDAYAALATAEHADGHWEAAQANLDRAVALGAARPSMVLSLSGVQLYHAGRYTEGIELQRGFLRHAEEARDHPTTVVVQSNLGMVLTGAGRYAEAEDHFRRSEALAERIGLHSLRARTISVSAGWRLDVFDAPGATAAASRAREIGAALEFPAPRTSATQDLAFLAVRAGQVAEAEALVQTVAGPVSKATGFHGWLWRTRAAVLAAEIAAARGRWNEALDLADHAIAACVEVRRFKYRVAGDVVRARALASLGRTDQAVVHLEAVLGEARVFGDPALLLRVLIARLAIDRSAPLRDEAGRQIARIESAVPDARTREAFLAHPSVRGL